MTDPSLTPMPRWIILSIAATTLIGVGFIAITTERALAGEPTLPQPLSAIAIIALASTVMGLLHRGCSLQIIGYMDRQVMSVAVRHDRRMNSIANGMIEHGIRLEEITGEIPRVRPMIVACPHPHDAGSLDPDVVSIARRAQRRLADDQN